MGLPDGVKNFKISVTV